MPKDYKRAPRQSGGSRPRRSGARQPSRLVWFTVGLASGVLGTIGVLWLEPSPEAVLTSIEQMRGSQQPEAPPEAKPRPRFDFYHLLPEMEVAVPEHVLDAPAPSPAPRAQTSRPAPAAAAPSTPASGVPASGAYVIQVGSFRRAEEADRLRASLALQGLEAHVQSVAIDGRDTWHRVRLGPFASVADVNAMRRRLKTLDLGAMVVKLKS